MEPQVQLTMSIDQADAVIAALDLFTRLGIGQLEELAQLVRYGVIPLAGLNQSGITERRVAPVEVSEQVYALMQSAKAALGFPSNGSHGIGHQHNHIMALRAYEVQKVLSKAVVVERNPNPMMRGVSYDGLTVRYTRDPAPVAEVVREP